MGITIAREVPVATPVERVIVTNEHSANQPVSFTIKRGTCGVAASLTFNGDPDFFVGMTAKTLDGLIEALIDIRDGN